MSTSEKDTGETILQEAQRIIYGDREKTYGDPGKNFRATADLWAAYYNGKYDSSIRFSEEDVAIFMIMLKVARQGHMNKRDNLVDICGYAGCIQKMEDYKNG